MGAGNSSARRDIHSWSTKTRVGFLTTGAFLFLIAVSRVVQSRDTTYDKVHLASFHATQYLCIFASGTLLGLTLAPSIVGAFQVLHQTIQATPSSQPNKLSPAQGLDRLPSQLAAVTLAVVMAPSLFWIVSSLNVFVDHHLGLVVEADVLVVLMGVLTGSAWYALLGRRAWLGVLVSLSMGLMLIGTVLSNAGW